MSDPVKRLEEEHAEIRRRVAELQRLLGDRRGIGWDDRTDCDVAALTSAWSGLRAFLSAHENGEEALMRSRWSGMPEIAEWIEKNHKAHDDRLRLLGSVAATCDGVHVHALRFALDELAAELEAHIGYEERVVFPLMADPLPSAGKGRRLA